MARRDAQTERTLETQRVLRKALLELVLEKGYDAVTVKDVTDRTGFERTTFYLYFKGKEDLLEQSQRQVIADLTALDPGSGAPGEGLQRMFRHVQENRREYRALMRVEAVARVEQRMVTNAIQAILNSGVLARLAPAGLQQPAVAAHFVATTTHAMALWWLELEPPIPAEDAARLTLGLLKSGLSSLIER